MGRTSFRIEIIHQLELNVPRLFIYIFLISCLALAACGQGSSELMAEGDQYMKDGNHQGAIVIYKTVLKNAPENMEARLGLAKAYLGAGKMEKADTSYEKYLRQNPYDKSILMDLARISGFRKDNAKAIQQLQEYIKEYPDSAEAYVLLGKFYWVIGEKDKTLETFERALEIEPNGSTARLALVQYYTSTDNKPEADRIVAEILTIDPTQHEALHYRGRDELIRGDVKAFEDTMGVILRHHPTDAYAKYSLAKSYITQQRNDQALNLANELKAGAPKTGYGQKLDGLVHYSNKEYKGAIDAFLESVSIRPDLETYLQLGLSQYGVGDFETAISNFRIVTDRAPHMVRAREMISLILFHQKRYNESIAEAEKVLEVDPESVIARVIKGDAYSAQGDPERALAQLKEITEKDPKYAAAFMKMGALHFAQGKMDKSEEALKGAVAASPGTVRPRLVLSNFYLRSGKKSLARKTLEEGLTGEKSDVVLYTYLARMELQARNPEKARELLAKAKSVDETNPAPYMMLASMSLSEKRPDEALAEYDALLIHRGDYLRALLGKAIVLGILGREGEIEAVYVKALETKQPNAFMAYASHKQRARDLEGALAVLDQGLASNPQHGEILKNKAETLFALKRFEDVLVMCDEIEKLNMQAAMSLRVRTYMLMDDVGKAVSTGRQICDLNPKEPSGYLILADVYMRTGQSENWGKILDEGIANCGPEARLLLDLSKYHASTGDYNKALTYLDTIIKGNDKFTTAHSMRGDIYARTGKDDEAIESYNKALSIDQAYVPALNNLAMIYLEDSKTASEALRLAYKAYLQVPWNPSVMDTFGYALAVNGKKDAAVTILEKAAAVESDNPVINYHLGYAYHKAGKKEQAVEMLKLVAECDDCDNAEDARKLLKTIK